MRKLNIKPLNLGMIISEESEKAALVEILDWVVSICQKNNIKYYLAEGTLLGAIRHEGFIPWDDDIDLIMLRPDYNKFISIAKNLEDKRFYIGYSLNDIRHSRPFMRAYDRSIVIEETYHGAKNYYNLNIDIFPSDGVPSNLSLYRIRCGIVKGLIGLASIDMSASIVTDNIFKSIVKIMLYPLAKAIGFRRWYKLVEKIGSAIKVEEADYIGVAVTPDCLKERIRKTIYLPQSKYMFEGKYYSGPQNYDDVLKKLYGEYMTPPPEKERVQAHNRVYYTMVEE